MSKEGYELITSVEQGADEFEVVVTFCQPYPDHEALFSSLAPAASYADPETYNTGWIGPINNDWMTGPFEVGTYDEAAQVVELVPSDTWWGDEPLLDSIPFTVISDDATPQAFANNEIDSFDVGPDPNGYALAFNTPGAEIRAAAGPNWRHVTLNSGPNGGLIQDQVVRRAIQMSLDRAAIGVSDLAGIPWPAKPLGSHVFVENSPFYVDNSGEFGTYDPEAAMALARRERLGRRVRRRAREGRATPARPPLADRRRAGVGERGPARPGAARRGRHRGRDRRHVAAGVGEHPRRRGVRDDRLHVDRYAVPVPRPRPAVRQRLGQQLRVLQHPRARPAARRAGDAPSTTRSGRRSPTRSTSSCGTTPTRSRCTSAPTCGRRTPTSPTSAPSASCSRRSGPTSATCNPVPPPECLRPPECHRPTGAAGNTPVRWAWRSTRGRGG